MSCIVFIGLGNMGGLMVVNLVKVGYVVCVFDLVFVVVQVVVDVGVIVVYFVLDILIDVEIVIFMLLVSCYVEGVYLGEDGLLVDIFGGVLLIDCSIIVLVIVCKVVEVVVVCGLQMFDVLVFGGIVGVQVGILIFIVGGDVEVFECVCLILQVMGKNIFYVGVSGVGQVVKLCNNMVLGVIMVVIGEFIVLGVVYGLDLKVLLQMMVVSIGCSWVIEVCNLWLGVLENVLVLCGYSGGFGSDLMFKDMGLVVEVVMSVGVLILFGEFVCNLYLMNYQVGCGKLDFFSVVQVIVNEM